jgi:hypothetical protein
MAALLVAREIRTALLVCAALFACGPPRDDLRIAADAGDLAPGGPGTDGPAPLGDAGGSGGTGGTGGPARDGAPGAGLPDGTRSFPVVGAPPNAPNRGAAMDAAAADLRVRSDAHAPEAGFRYPNPDGRLCGSARHTLARMPAELLVVLDRSSSMGAVTTPGRTRWIDARDAVISAVSNASTLAWGLKVFPSIGAVGVGPPGCGVARGVEVATGFGRVGPIGNALIHAGPPTGPLGGFTPTETAILASTAYLQTVTSAFPKYMVLVTDGSPNCDSVGGSRLPALEATMKALADAAAAGFKTFVIGMGTGTLTASLNRLADAGGMPRAVEPRYHAAENRADLHAALQAISVAVTSCVFPLVTRPLDPDFVGVTVGSTPVPRDLDRIDGWDYVNDGTAIEIYGPACDALETGAAPTADIHFGCPS